MGSLGGLHLRGLYEPGLTAHWLQGSHQPPGASKAQPRLPMGPSGSGHVAPHHLLGPRGWAEGVVCAGPAPTHCEGQQGGHAVRRATQQEGPALLERDVPAYLLQEQPQDLCGEAGLQGQCSPQGAGMAGGAEERPL